MRPLDVITLAKPVGRWPTGSQGTILEEGVPGVLLVEFGTETGDPERVEVPFGSVHTSAAAA